MRRALARVARRSGPPTALPALLIVSIAGGTEPPFCGTEHCPPCAFVTTSASRYEQAPLRFDSWDTPLLITGAAARMGRWSAPFDHIERLKAGGFDRTTVAAGAGGAIALLEGSAVSAHLSLANFTRRMGPADAVFDTQNSAAGRHAELTIPGVPAGAAGGHESRAWWNVLSIGSQYSGLALHEHGAAWLALGSGSKLWMVYPPLEAPLSAYAALRGAREWLLAPPAGALTCVQPPGSVVLMPAGFAHATLNLEPSWAVGRQRQWPAQARYNAASPLLNVDAPQMSSPAALLNAGLALKGLTLRESRERGEHAAAKYAQPAVGMLATVAGLGIPRDLRGNHQPDQPPPPPTVLRIRACLALIDVATVRFAHLDPQPFWAGPNGLPAAREAAQVAETLLRKALLGGSQDVIISAAELLDRLGLWWLSRQEKSAAAGLFVAARSAAMRALHFNNQTGADVSIAAKGVHIASALHAGVVLAMQSACETALPFLHEAWQEISSGLLAPWSDDETKAWKKALHSCR